MGQPRQVILLLLFSLVSRAKKVEHKIPGINKLSTKIEKYLLQETLVALQFFPASLFLHTL